MALFGAAVVLASCLCAGLWWRRARPMPLVAAFGLGAATLSSILFLMAVTRVVSLASLIALAVLAIVPAIVWARRPARVKEPLSPAVQSLDRGTAALCALIAAAYLVLYVAHAAAPEIQPDAMTYHLGLASEYLRIGGFPDRIAFYEVLPQGMDLLFMWAFAFGAHEAAKFVHLGFLIATVPLLFAIVRRLGWPDRVAAGAAVLYACAPVTGVTATSAYTEAGMVFFSLLAFYLLLIQRHFGAGIAAGFCYAVKFPGLIVPAAVFLWAAARRRGALAVLLGAFLVIAPWMARNAVVVGNPMGPLLNRWFPNPHFSPELERELAQSWRTYSGFAWQAAPWDLAVRGRLQGVLGPVFLLLPLGFFALRERRGRIVWAAAAMLAIPWFFNAGARFILPAAAIAGIALAASLPRIALLAMMAAHAVLSWPAAIPLYANEHVWSLQGFPWRVDREQYLRDHDEYVLAKLIQNSTKPGERVFALASVARAYTDREILEYWHSASGAAFLDMLRATALYSHVPLYAWGAGFPPRVVEEVRFRLTRDHPGEWDANAFRAWSGDDLLYSGGSWRATPDTNWGDGRLAVDGNTATRWRTYTPMRAGMRFDIALGRPQTLTRVELLSHSPVYDVPLEVWLRAPKGDWEKVADAHAAQLPPADLRREAARALRNAGYNYILAPVERFPLADLGKALAASPAAWDMEEVWHAGWASLLRIHARRM